MSQPFFARPLTSSEVNELRGLIRGGKDARIVRRAQMVLFSTQGRTPAQIGACWGSN
jgi:hypothetical protein